MKALKKAEESQQGSLKENEPTLRELADELSLEPKPEPVGAAKQEPPLEKPASGTDRQQGESRQQAAANLFAAKAPHVGKRNRFVVILSVVALLLFAGGGAYVYIAINKPGMLVSARAPAQPLPVSPPSPRVEEPLPMALDSVPVATEPPELFSARPEVPDHTLPVQEAPKPSAPPIAQPDGAIRVSRGEQREVNPELAQGYQSLKEGRLDAANMHYQRLLQQEPRNVDVLLGMAAVAARSNNTGEAAKLYSRALEVEPMNVFARAGLLNLLGGSDPAGSEAKLKQLLTEKPAGFLHFALGNLYAAQGRWPEAQRAYFDAYHAEPDNPDHAFNLAVSLEHIGQPKSALTYYQRALQLLESRAAGFERATVLGRIAKLQRTSE